MFLLFLFHSPFLSSPFLYFVLQTSNPVSTSCIHAISFEILHLLRCHFGSYCTILFRFFLSHVSSLPIPFPIFIFPFSLLRFTNIQPCFYFPYSRHLFRNSPPPALSFWFILYNPFPRYFICHCTQTFYRILSTSIYFMHLVPSVLNPISTFLMWYSLVQPSRISSVLTVTFLLLEICSLLGYNAASSGNFLLTFQDDISVPSSGGHADVTDRLSRNVGKKLPLLAEW